MGRFGAKGRGGPFPVTYSIYGMWELRILGSQLHATVSSIPTHLHASSPPNPTAS